MLLIAIAGCKPETKPSVDPTPAPDPQPPAGIPVESVTLDNNEALMWPEVVVHCITATVLPENATDKTVTWETSDPAIATVEGGEVVAHEEGEVTITAKAGGKSASCHIIVASDKPKMVDMGLSVKWADRNVGAVALRDYGEFVSALNLWGYYFSWGNCYEQEVYEWDYCKHIKNVNGDYFFTKYFGDYSDASYWVGEGAPDGKLILDPEDDAAVESYAARYGEKWRMPSQAEWAELVENCSLEFTELYGVKVAKVTSNINGASIYLPLAGYMVASDRNYDKESQGYYWSSSLYSEGLPPYSAYCFRVSEGSPRLAGWDRYIGCSVRAVYGDRPHASGVLILNAEVEPMLPEEYVQLRAKVLPDDAIDNRVTWSSSNPEVATVDENGLVSALRDGAATITAKTVDGGFTSSIDITVPDHFVEVNSLDAFNNCTTGIPCWILDNDITYGTQIVTRQSGIINLNGHKVYNVHMRNNTLGRLVLLCNGTVTNLLDGNVGWGAEYVGTVVLDNLKVGNVEQGVYTDGHHYVVKSGEYVGFSTYGKNGSVIIYGGKFGLHFDSNPDADYNQSPVTIYGGKFAFNPATTAGYMGRSKITIPAGYSVKENTDSDKDNYPYIVTAD